MREHETIETQTQTQREREPRVEERRAPTLAVKTGVRAGSWKLGNKVWTDDWLTPV